MSLKRIPSVPTDFQPYYGIISAYASARIAEGDSDRLYLERDVEWACTLWVAGLLKLLLAAINQANPAVTPAQVRLADRCAAGHCDWHRKLAFYCSELARN